MNKILFQLLLWRRFVPPFRENTIQNIYTGLEALRSHKQEGGSPFSKNTLHDTVAIFKPFYQWMIDEGIPSIPEKKLRQIRTPPADTMTKTAASLLTKEEVEAMIRASPTPGTGPSSPSLQRGASGSGRRPPSPGGSSSSMIMGRW